MAVSRLCLPKAAAARHLMLRSVQKPAVFARPVRFFRRTCAQAEPQKDITKQEGKSNVSRHHQQGGSDLTPVERGRGTDMMMRPFFPPGFGRMSRYIDQMQREMDELMGRMLPGTSSLLDPFMTPSLETSLLSPGQLSRQLALEVEEDDNSYTLRAAVPGLSKDDVKVTLSDDNVLTIRGEKKEQTEQVVEGGKRTSSMFRSVFKQVHLPQHVGTDQIKAETKDGVLTVVLPKVDVKERHKEIPVN